MLTLLTAALLTGDAQAFFPDDVSLSAMSTWQGNSVTDTALITDAYRQIVRELGSAVANKPAGPAETLGVNGFAVGLDSSFSFISADGVGNEPSPWERAHVDGTPSRLLWAPRLVVQKGLPLSLELGASAGYVAFSRQTLMSGWGRLGLLEGYSKAPDLSLQVGYAGYIGNEELELGAMDVGLTIGYGLPFGTIAGIRETQFQPFAGVGRLYVHAAPRLSAGEQEALGVGPVSGFKGSESFDEDFRLLQVQGGFQLTKGAFQFHAAGAYTVGTLASVNLGLGFVY